MLSDIWNEFQERVEIEDVGLYEFFDVDDRIATTGFLSLDEITEDVLNEDKEEDMDEIVAIEGTSEASHVSLQEAEVSYEIFRRYAQLNTGFLNLPLLNVTFYLYILFSRSKDSQLLEHAWSIFGERA